LREELRIFAQGDTVENQLNAIAAISIINDEQSAKLIASLLSNWDVEVRRAAANALKKMKPTNQALDVIEEKAKSESDEGIRNILRRMVVKWRK